MDEQAEKAAELEAKQELKEEEVRAKIIAEYGFDEVDDQERIDKLTKKEIDSHKKLSTAIGQKIKNRDELAALKNDPRLKETPAPKTEVEPPVDVAKAVAEQLEKRDLDGLEYPDPLKKEIQRVAQVQGISIKAALRDPYIVFQLDAHEKERKQEESAISRNNRSGGSKKFSVENPPDSDMSTAEGRKEWEEYKVWLDKQ